MKVLVFFVWIVFGVGMCVVVYGLLFVVLLLE